MRAGSLSDPRIVAVLQKYFVCVHMTELCAKDLIKDPADVALLERYHKSSNGMFFGGEREAFFTPDGRLLDVFLSLHAGDSQMTAAGRLAVDPAVTRFLRSAANAYEKTHGSLPEDWRALCRGVAPEVAAVRAAKPPKQTAAAGELRLRLAMRHDWMLYTDLSGWEHIVFRDAECLPMVPDGRVDAMRRWPRKMFLRLARSLYPRGGGVVVDVEDASITGFLESRATQVTATEIRGTIRGTFELRPQSDRERSRRDTYRPFLWSRGKLSGDFVWNRKQQRFTKLRMVGVDAKIKSTWTERGDQGVHTCLLGIESLPLAPAPKK